MPTYQQATSIFFEHCTSTAWDSVGKALASLPSLHTLAFLRCNTGDAFYRQLSSSNSLLQLRVGTSIVTAEHCGITEEGVLEIASMRQLEELVLSTTEDNPPTAKTLKAFEAIFRHLKSLKVLKMREPAIQVINIRL